MWRMPFAVWRWISRMGGGNKVNFSADTASLQLALSLAMLYSSAPPEGETLEYPQSLFDLLRTRDGDWVHFRGSWFRREGWRPPETLMHLMHSSWESLHQGGWHVRGCPSQEPVVPPCPISLLLLLLLYCLVCVCVCI